MPALMTRQWAWRRVGGPGRAGPLLACSMQVSLDDSSQLNPRHLRLVASYVVPITGQQDYGSWPRVPAQLPQQHGVEWSQHTVANGATRRANGRRAARESGGCPQTDGTGL